MARERPIFKLTVEKILKNTGTINHPFYAMSEKIRRIRIFGLLIYKFSGTSIFPDSYKGKSEIE